MIFIKLQEANNPGKAPPVRGQVPQEEVAGGAAAEAPGSGVMVTSQWGRPCILCAGARQGPRGRPPARGHDKQHRKCLSWTRRGQAWALSRGTRPGQASPTEGNLTPSVTGRRHATLCSFQRESKDGLGK